MPKPLLKLLILNVLIAFSTNLEAYAQPVNGNFGSATLHESKPDKNEPETISFKRRTYEIQIKDPEQRAVYLYLSQSGYLVEAKKLVSKRKRYSFRVPEGKYVVEDVDGVKYPLPVLASADITKLKIPVRSPAQEETKAKSWAWIPAGPAMIGDELGVGAEDEGRARIKYIDAFWLQSHEVTNQQYASFLTVQPELDPRWIDLESRQCKIQVQKSETGPPSFTTDSPDKPVVMVSLYGAEAYCEWLTSTTGRTHRLPTETEWEKASRGPQSWVYAYGDRYRRFEANQESGELRDVKQFSPNGFGLYDMTGNVFEWMANKYKPNEPDSQMNQALRGGSFVLDGMYLRNSFRMRQSPSVMTDDIGFRVLREAIQKEQR